MIEIVKFNKDHIKLINIQPSQKQFLEDMTAAEKLYMEASEFAFSAIENGVVIGCAGIVELWPGRGHAWSLLGDNLGSKFVAIHRAVSRAIKLAGYRRVEMDIDANDPAAIKWAELLGFYNETPGGMVNYSDDGRIYMKYVRVK